MCSGCGKAPPRGPSFPSLAESAHAEGHKGSTRGPGQEEEGWPTKHLKGSRAQGREAAREGGSRHSKALWSGEGREVLGGKFACVVGGKGGEGALGDAQTCPRR